MWGSLAGWAVSAPSPSWRVPSAGGSGVCLSVGLNKASYYAGDPLGALLRFSAPHQGHDLVAIDVAVCQLVGVAAVKIPQVPEYRPQQSQAEAEHKKKALEILTVMSNQAGETLTSIHRAATQTNKTGANKKMR
eukprot:GHVT01096452.1.p2 GENE.GHVT01096452.1~~GHVT01096452.1.p2  ORF type:complete len:134 (+),score=21.76 GHVT01096452.1:2780-3181(+)